MVCRESDHPFREIVSRRKKTKESMAQKKEELFLKNLIDKLASEMRSRLSEVPETKSILEDFSGSGQISRCNVLRILKGCLDASPQIEGFTDILNLWPRDHAKKDSAKSARFREMGNRALKAGRNAEALECYNKAVLAADYQAEPLTDGLTGKSGEGAEPTLALALANRAVVLARLRKWDETIQGESFSSGCYLRK